ncbi:hypothetical protein Q4Q35_08190 [Flavivirga aquimarina]|uniref:DUF4919 domain-containing protein n=1 Tax=Flavivirga aquimarina TaxID=2027862 RepID=A0ABT8W9H0_9FLAO|nr:hypothetical protein [Flavivirga aquimarina]MDO5969784.1 hypothetical protein [Flavivirga aquimarina]
MNLKYILLVIILALYINCIEKNEETKKDYEHEVLEKKVVLEEKTPKPSLDKEQFVISKEKLEGYKMKSNQHIGLIDQNDDVLDIGASGKIVYYPFGVKSFADSINIKQNNIFTKDTIDSLNENFRDYLLSFKESKIKIREYKKDYFPDGEDKLAEYHHQKQDLSVILEAKLYNSEIALIDNIRVGMSKEEFFAVIIGDYDDDLKRINTIILGDMIGNMSQFYKFKNDSLFEVVFKLEN